MMRDTKPKEARTLLIREIALKKQQEQPSAMIDIEKLKDAMQLQKLIGDDDE